MILALNLMRSQIKRQVKAMGFRGSNGTSHKIKRRKNNWKSEYIKQRTQDAKNPSLKAHKYVCSSGHIRIEKNKLSDNTLQCEACEKDGKTNRLCLNLHGNVDTAKDHPKRLKSIG